MYVIVCKRIENITLKIIIILSTIHDGIQNLKWFSFSIGHREKRIKKGFKDFSDAGINPNFIYMYLRRCLLNPNDS